MHAPAPAARRYGALRLRFARRRRVLQQPGAPGRAAGLGRGARHARRTGGLLRAVGPQAMAGRRDPGDPARRRAHELRRAGGADRVLHGGAVPPAHHRAVGRRDRADAALDRLRAAGDRPSRAADIAVALAAEHRPAPRRRGRHGHVRPRATRAAGLAARAGRARRGGPARARRAGTAERARAHRARDARRARAPHLAPEHARRQPRVQPRAPPRRRSRGRRA